MRKRWSCPRDLSGGPDQSIISDSVILVIVTSAHHLFYCRTEKDRVFLGPALEIISNKSLKWRTNWAVIDPRWSHRGG